MAKMISEEFRVKGEDLLKKIKDLIHEGNIRKIIIKDKDGRTYLEIPLSFGVAGLVLAPVWAAVGALAALVADFKIEIEKKEENK